MVPQAVLAMVAQEEVAEAVTTGVCSAKKLAAVAAAAAAAAVAAAKLALVPRLVEAALRYLGTTVMESK